SEEAWEETTMRLEQYRRLYEDVLAIPVLRGRKPEHDKFPGADITTTVEALMPDGKSVQGGTSHHLGQSFAEAFDITYVDENEEEQTAFTTSWGLSWRALGALIMTHSDDQGLVLPPDLAPEQIVVVPIYQEETQEDVLTYARDMASELEAGDLRVHLDDRDERNPGFKFNEWELKGVPLRIEVGPNEVDAEEVTLVHRPDGETRTVDRSELVDTVEANLDEVFAKLYAAAEETLEENVREADSRDEILGTIGRYGGYVKAPWCGNEACETEIKEQIHAEIVMVPFEEDHEPIGSACAVCGEDATQTAYFAKSY
ncbi:MAG: His/Gly/Thr/Pro-type tRNA ligase C-terminal domain-containing protein, partial [Halodesulfurarchaeum sp.]